MLIDRSRYRVDTGSTADRDSELSEIEEVLS